jgi:hypothetical protein
MYPVIQHHLILMGMAATAALAVSVTIFRYSVRAWGTSTRLIEAAKRSQ